MDRITGIQLFIRIVETGSFSKASVDLGVTQPTATKHVAAVEARLGARLLNRNTRGVSATEIGALYYEKCKAIQRELEEADNLASLLQSRVGGQLRISTSVAFGRRVLTPLVLEFMRQHPEVSIDLSFDDRYVNLVEQGVDVAIRMGRLADSSLGARYLGRNPWVLVASPAYLKAHGAPTTPADVAAHPCLIYSSVQGDERWHFTGGPGQTGALGTNGSTSGSTDGHDAPREQSVAVHGPLRTNNLSVVLEAALGGMGLAILPWYVAHEAVRAGRVVPLLADHALPVQEMHAVFPSPKLVPSKVASFIDFLQGRFTPQWWKGAA
ncbi:MAG: LysR family transcriptional regulator [Burkholderiales bacterium]|nr:LysR family transcriptional regulator [Burkholderiales bacterium]